MSFDEVAWLRDNSPAWRLLRADNAPLVLSFLHQVFVTENVRSIPAAELTGRLDDELYALNERGRAKRAEAVPQAGQGVPGRLGRARGRLAAQVLPRGHRRAPCRRHSRGGEGAAVGRQPEGARVRRHRVAAEHDRRPAAADRLRHRDRPGAAARRAAATARRTWTTQIARIEAGQVDLLDASAVRDRYQQFSATARELLADFREVEENFRKLDRQLREKITGWRGGKGELLDDVLGSRETIAGSDQGKSFQAFYDFLLSQARQAGAERPAGQRARADRNHRERSPAAAYSL